MNLCLLFLLISLFSANRIFPQALVEVSKTKIGLGTGEAQVGVEKGGGEHWKPLFFSVDKEGLIHIPDFYKGRIAIFDSKGKLARSIGVKEGISPRMNYFSLVSGGRYVTFGDYTLYLLRKDGTLSWKRQLGYGAIPESLFANGAGIFLVLPGKDGRAVVFDYASDRPLGMYGFKDGEAGVPMIRSEGNIDFTFSLSYMSKIPDSGFAEDAFKPDVEAFFLFADRANKSLWKRSASESEELFLYSAEGKLIKKASIYYPESEIEGNGFWSVADEKMNVYKNYFFEDYMLVVRYAFN